MGWYLLDGACHETTGEPLPYGAVKVPRPPNPGESWDFGAGEWVLDAAAAAAFGQSDAARERASLMREIEASLVLSGITLTHGILAEEAAATGASLTDLATAANAEAAELRGQAVASLTSAPTIAQS